ncbi:MAG: FtsQ-type POTRA domain-containing protein [Verrucomicrobiota bacterium]
MSKSRTSKTRRRSRSKVLEVRVMSPRIAWFGFLKFAGKVAKFACILAVVTGIGWGIWQGIQHAFYKNPDFRLQVIDLNPNPAIDEAGVVEAGGINLTASLFEINVDELTVKLNQRPEISSARVERHLPGTLVVRVIPRTPCAWISCPDAGITETRKVGAMLVDHDGIAYPCPVRQLDAATNLPLVHLPASEKFPIAAGKMVSHPELRHCFHLLNSARESDSDAVQWIESVRQINDWSLLLVTRDGTEATFGIGGHEQQIHRLRAAMEHAGQEGYVIGTINLIPKHNVPVTLRTEKAAPKAVPVSEPTPADRRKDRRASDLNKLLNRN